MSKAWWCRVASDFHTDPKIIRAGRMGREVFLFLLLKRGDLHREVPNPTIPDEWIDPVVLSQLLQADPDECAQGVEDAIDAGLIGHDGVVVEIRGFTENWYPQTSRDRTRRWRQRKGQRVTGSDASVTTGDAVVTRCDDEKRAVTGKNKNKNKKTSPPKGPPLLFGVTPKRKRKLSEPTAEELPHVIAVLDKLNERTGRAYRGSKAHLQLIVGRIRDRVREGQSLPDAEMDLRKVIGYCWHPSGLNWGDPAKGMADYMRPETLFGPRGIERYLDAARAWYEERKGKQ